MSVTVFANVFYGASHRPCRNPHDAAHRQLPRRRKSDKRSRCGIEPISSEVRAAGVAAHSRTRYIDNMF